jgi:GntR family phosphonate transport system transcriptional regulator
MTMHDAASGVALWRQVADGIERGIADGTFASGERLPGETEIAETYRVNRHTVRRALAMLSERGLVRAERGSGTYVEAPRLAYPLRSRTRFSEIVGAGGREPRGHTGARDTRTGTTAWPEDRSAIDSDRGVETGRPHADLRRHHLACGGALPRSWADL